MIFVELGRIPTIKDSEETLSCAGISHSIRPFGLSEQFLIFPTNPSTEDFEFAGKIHQSGFSQILETLILSEKIPSIGSIPPSRR